MNGPELYPLLFARTAHGDATAFAKQVNMSLEAVRSKFKALKRVDKEILKKYAAYKGYNEEKFLAWCSGPLQSEPYQDSKAAEYSTAEREPSMVNEASALPYSGDNYAILRQELKKVFKENVMLHTTIADRGIFIIELLDR